MVAVDTHKSMHIQKLSETHTHTPNLANEAVACMTGAECLCQRALCSLGFGFSLTLHEEAVDLQNKISLDKDI